VQREIVNSGSIRSVGYDPRTQALEIEFTSGTIEQYQRVSSEVYRRFMAAPTKTSFYRDNIEESYSSRRVR